ncbi:MAG: DNA-directed RNA polymerase subunit H [Euryarchaeota archaeon]|nr:DNA-directed RNA polymerase subunit H [Euryarchaeota archaeon]
MARFDIRDHELVPEHEILPPEEAEKILEEYNISRGQLPKILSSDPVVKIIKAEVGDIIRIKRKSPTSGISINYRVVTEQF